MSQFRIFLAEDNPADVYLIEQALIECGLNCELRVAENGKKALAFFQSGGLSGTDSLPDLILLDLNLPQHDGAELLHGIRANPAFDHVPVVVLTSSDSPRDRMTAIESGASLYIRKPSSLDDFLAIGNAMRSLLADHSASRKGASTC
jgi:chemotaxis family two-component system response regulator Rcp1